MFSKQSDASKCVLQDDEHSCGSSINKNVVFP